jgi:hypothetical protein
MPRTRTGLFAYTTRVDSSADCIRETIKAINDTSICILKSWEDLFVSGRLIITPILSAIDQADFFCADLTGLNDNVLFETGYAIAKGKPVWITLDSSKEKQKMRFNELGFLTTIGYTSYTNTHDLINKFYANKVYENSHCLLNDFIKQMTPPSEQRIVLLLKGQVDTNYGQQIVTDLENKKLPFHLDDANEIKILPITWYMQKLQEVFAVIAEFSSTERAGFELQNSKCAFICGLSLGLGKNLLMVAENPYNAPLDYKELLFAFSNRQQLRSATDPFFEKIKNEIGEKLTNKKKIEMHLQKRSHLQNLQFGEFIAEHESEGLSDYFVETVDFKNIVKSEYNIVIGRKGTGKTALFITF